MIPEEPRGDCPLCGTRDLEPSADFPGELECPWCRYLTGADDEALRRGDRAVRCDAVNCQTPADWAYLEQGCSVYLCEFHGGTEDVDGWTRVRHD